MLRVQIQLLNLNLHFTIKIWLTKLVISFISKIDHVTCKLLITSVSWLIEDYRVAGKQYTWYDHVFTYHWGDKIMGGQISINRCFSHKSNDPPTYIFPVHCFVEETSLWDISVGEYTKLDEANTNARIFPIMRGKVC